MSVNCLFCEQLGYEPVGPTLHTGWFGSKSLMYPNVLSYGENAGLLMVTLGSWLSTL